MSNKVAIVTDSTAYIPAELTTQYNIRVVPQVLIWGGQTFEDGVDIQPDEFYTRLQTAKTMPTTSQVTPKSFEQVFRELHQQGYDILAILLSEKLSGTIASAVQIQEIMTEARIEIVDSYSVAMALGFQVLHTARAAEAGKSLAECKAIAERAREHTGVILAVDTLEFLHRGGRIGGGSRFIGTALSIKPILEMKDGVLEGVEQVRTRKKSLNRLVELIKERTGGRTPLRLAGLHANATQEAQAVLAAACSQLPVDERILSEVSPVVGTHVGPGTVALAFMAGM